MRADLQVQAIESMPFAENTYIAYLPGRQDCVVIDPGLEPDLILSFLAEAGLNVAAILNTHGHADHIGGNAALKEAYPDAPLIIGAGDAAMLTDPWENLSAVFGTPITSPPADRTLQEGEVLEMAGQRWQVLGIPGHSPGHIVFRDLDRPVVFGGDVLFAGSVGRTDFPGGSFDQLAAGIRDKLFVLPDDVVVYPGHGPATTIGSEKRTNPFVGLTAGRLG
ncbi:MAG TPA: MBL fold metallo-hydrolase [Gemmatales bacterium]|nr:MBL fold metallo-hydrolase [Gemmatales bacterium]